MTYNNTNTISAPSFDNFNGNNPTLSETLNSSVDGTISAQNIILNSEWSTFFGISLVISLFFAVGIFYSLMRLHQIRKTEKKYFESFPPSTVARKVFGIEGIGVSGIAENKHTSRWRDIMLHANSNNPNDWRQAILDADIMLDAAITSRGYTGDGIGEKMKQVNRGDINTIDDAWEAHKVRNRVAHEGSNSELSQREARRAIGLYENVFRELGYVQ